MLVGINRFTFYTTLACFVTAWIFRVRVKVLFGLYIRASGTVLTPLPGLGRVGLEHGVATGCRRRREGCSLVSAWGFGSSHADARVLAGGVFGSTANERLWRLRARSTKGTGRVTTFRHLLRCNPQASRPNEHPQAASRNRTPAEATSRTGPWRQTFSRGWRRRGKELQF